MTTPEPKGYLFVDHPRGREIHPIIKASWNLYRGKDPDADVLHFFISADIAFWNSVDALELATPWWEICVVEPRIDPEPLSVGAQFDVPQSWSEERGGVLTAFQFFSHEGTEQSRVHVLGADGEKWLMRMTGSLSPDSGLGDNAQPDEPSFISAVAWFEHDPTSVRLAC